MAEPAQLQDYRAPAPKAIEQPVFDAAQGWIELRRYLNGEEYVAWTVMIKSKVPRHYSSDEWRDQDMELCRIKVPIHARKFEKLNENARLRAMAILRAWRGDQREADHDDD